MLSRHTQPFTVPTLTKQKVLPFGEKLARRAFPKR
jgi:hypothetical protein